MRNCALSLYEYCFVVFANQVLPPNLTEVTAFYSATNVAGLQSIFSSDPIYFDFTPPEIEKGAFSINSATPHQPDQSPLCLKVPSNSLLERTTPDFEIIFRFAQIYVESGVDGVNVMFVRESLANLSTVAGRWHYIPLDLQVPTVQLSSRSLWHIRSNT